VVRGFLIGQTHHVAVYWQAPLSTRGVSAAKDGRVLSGRTAVSMGSIPLWSTIPYLVPIVQ